MRSRPGPAGRRAALLLLLFGAGCRTWRAVPPPSAGAPTALPRVRVLRLDGSRVEVGQVNVRRDTLYGERRAAIASGYREVVAVPVDSVRRLEARRVSAARTGALAGGILLGVAAAVYAFASYVGFWSA
jgi:hypothetical protein